LERDFTRSDRGSRTQGFGGNIYHPRLPVSSDVR
jgi:hypothetical protein